MNERSTRAHSVLILSLKQRDATGTKKLGWFTDDQKHAGFSTVSASARVTTSRILSSPLIQCPHVNQSESKFFFADLGGSEQIKKSKVWRAWWVFVMVACAAYGVSGWYHQPDKTPSSVPRPWPFVRQVSGRNRDVAEGVGYVMGTRMREAIYINTGLLALKQ